MAHNSAQRVPASAAVVPFEAAPDALAGSTDFDTWWNNKSWLEKNWLGCVIPPMTWIPYSFINAAFVAAAGVIASNPQADLGLKIFFGLILILCAAATNIFFDRLAAQDDILRPAYKWGHTLTRAYREGDLAKAGWQLSWLVPCILALVGSFCTSLTFKIVARKAIDYFSYLLPQALITGAQSLNTVYAFFATLLFTSGCMHIPELFTDLVAQPNVFMKRFALLGTLIGLTFGIGTYFAITNALNSFPAEFSDENGQNVYKDVFDQFLLDAIAATGGQCVWAFGLTQALFCMLNAGRGVVEIGRHTYGLVHGPVAERPKRALLLTGASLLAIGSVFTSTYLGLTGNDKVAAAMITVVAFHVNVRGNGNYLRNVSERRLTDAPPAVNADVEAAVDRPLLGDGARVVAKGLTPFATLVRENPDATTAETIPGVSTRLYNAASTCLTWVWGHLPSCRRHGGAGQYTSLDA